MLEEKFEGQTIQLQKKKGKMTNNDLQNATQKNEDWATRIPLKPGVNSGAPERYAFPAPLVALEILLKWFINIITTIK